MFSFWNVIYNRDYLLNSSMPALSIDEERKESLLTLVTFEETS